LDKKALTNFFQRLDRSLFLDNEYKPYVRFDMPLPIGSEQTISQPSLVANMTLMLNPQNNSRVLEIGTGSGYQTAFLAEFSKEVYTIERLQEFTDKARERLNTLGYDNVYYRTGDGSEGWLEQAPFDRIIVTAAAGTMPDALVAQLVAKGRMVVPVGKPNIQILKLVCKDASGIVSIRDTEMVRFVEMKGRYGWN
jgi:protein-L-isoaspartate(D-aspartate) O-methyltransferase